ncbi:MAG: TIGR02444 family protein [Kordiimonadaceae bacterium]|nr:TIGR02444 family protein [Kordiimonadaceae bacterium]MBO6567625.1 TIGR02444 family protein [Kordiimonadaceae bacterium]MBO6963161.1 TIGR02444 family protein [Kordiimonadaceae bacterium]
MPKISAEEFWQFSIKHYDNDAVKNACLSLQDSAGADVNLLLLAIWLRTLSITISGETLANLFSTSTHWQTEKIVPLREKRCSQPRQSDGYTKLLALELDAEKGEQRALIQCLKSAATGNSAKIDFWDAYTEQLGVSDTHRGALLGPLADK